MGVRPAGFVGQANRTQTPLYGPRAALTGFPARNAWMEHQLEAPARVHKAECGDFGNTTARARGYRSKKPKGHRLS